MSASLHTSQALPSLFAVSDEVLKKIRQSSGSIIDLLNHKPNGDKSSANEIVRSCDTDKDLHLVLVTGGTNQKLSLVSEKDGVIDDTWNATIGNEDGKAMQRIWAVVSSLKKNADSLGKYLDLIIAWAGKRTTEPGEVTRQNVSIDGFNEPDTEAPYKTPYPLGAELSKALGSSYKVKLKTHSKDGRDDALWKEAEFGSGKKSLDVFIASDLIMKGLEQANSSGGLKQGEAVATVLSGTGFNQIFLIGPSQFVFKPFSGAEPMESEQEFFQDDRYMQRTLEPFRNAETDSVDYWFAGGNDENPYMGLKATANYLSGRLPNRDSSERTNYSSPLKKSRQHISSAEMLLAQKLFPKAKRHRYIKERVIRKLRQSKLITKRPAASNGQWSNIEVMRFAREGDILAKALCKNLAYRMGRLVGLRFKNYLDQHFVSNIKELRFTSSNVCDLFSNDMNKECHTKMDFVSGLHNGIGRQVIRWDLTSNIISEKVLKKRSISLNEDDLVLEGIPALIQARYNFNKHFGVAS